MMGIILLIIYSLGVIYCGYLIYSKYNHTYMNVIEIFFLIYLMILSWIGVFSLYAGAFTSYNQRDKDEDE